MLIHGAAHPWDLGYYSELRFLENNFENFYYLPTIINSDSSWNGLVDPIEKHLEKKLLETKVGIIINPKETFFLLCGNPIMVKSVSSYLSKFKYTHLVVKKPGYLHIGG